MIKAVIFDAGDVVYYRDEVTLKPMLDFLRKNGFNISAKAFLKAYDANSLALYKGKVSKDDNLKNVLKFLKIRFNEQFFDKFAKIFRKSFSDIKIKENVYEIFERIKSKGMKIAVLTDTFSSEEKKWEWFKSIDVAQFIDIIVCSSVTGFTKDKKEAYTITLQKLNLKPKEAIFVGHKKYEMTGAKLANVKSVSLEKDAGADYYVSYISNILNLIYKLN